MNKTFLAIVLALAAIGVAGWIIVRGTGGDSPQREKAPPMLQEILVFANPFSFDPGGISVNKGDTVKIILKSTEGEHNFIIDILSIASPTVKQGEETVIEFSADRSGMFEYYSSLPGDREAGLRGVLSVLE